MSDHPLAPWTDHKRIEAETRVLELEQQLADVREHRDRLKHERDELRGRYGEAFDLIRWYAEWMGPEGGSQARAFVVRHDAAIKAMAGVSAAPAPARRWRCRCGMHGTKLADLRHHNEFPGHDAIWDSVRAAAPAPPEQEKNDAGSQRPLNAALSALHVAVHAARAAAEDAHPMAWVEADVVARNGCPLCARGGPTTFEQAMDALAAAGRSEQRERTRADRQGS